MRRRVFSGMQPTGEAHLGNYLGALRQWVDLQDGNDCLFSIVDHHATTVTYDPREMPGRIFDMAVSFLAVGLDPDRCTIFVQSDVREHTELAWVLNTVAPLGELERMTQFKDKAAGMESVPAGLLNYPVLMAADILLYQADLVPVGDDQKQHVELTRDIATRFNNIYGDVFSIPEPYIPKVGARIMSLQDPTSKMSKSEQDSGGCICLLDKPEDIMRAFKRAVTDSETVIRYDVKNKPGISNLMQIYSVCTGKSFEEIEQEFADQGYGAFKKAVGEATVELLRPLQEEFQRIWADKAYLEEVCAKGAERARQRAAKTLEKVYRKVGFVPKKRV